MTLQPAILVYVKGTPQQRFDAKVQRDGECLIWTAARGQSHGRPGYGQMRINHRLYQAHRLAWMWAKGPIPSSMTLDHLCRNVACVRVDHLEVVSVRENILRSNSLPAMRARQTHCKYGHPFDETNTHRTPAGRRACRACFKRKNDLRPWRNHPDRR